MSDQKPQKLAKLTPKKDFDTVKLTVSNMEEKRIRDDKDKTKKLKAARLQKVENDKISLK